MAPQQSQVSEQVSERKSGPSKAVNNPRGSRGRRNRNPTPVLGDDSLGDKIRSEIRRGYECMICMSEIKFYQSIWACKTCYKLFHMSCTHEVC